MKKEEIYLDLSKCSQEEIENVLAVLPKKEFEIQYKIFNWDYKLHLSEDGLWWVINSVESKSKAEITYSQFMELFKTQPTELEKEMFEFLERLIENDVIKMPGSVMASNILEKYKNKYGG